MSSYKMNVINDQIVVYYDHNVKRKMLNLSEKIKTIRLNKNLSQDKFAKLLGFSKGYLADIETGRTSPSRNFLNALEFNAGISIESLLKENQILNTIEHNIDQKNPYIIFLFAFIREGLDYISDMLLNLIKDKTYILIDASNLTQKQLLQKISGDDSPINKLVDLLQYRLVSEELILIIKNLSLSKIPNSGALVRSIFKIMDDFDPSLYKRRFPDIVFQHEHTRSSLIIIDTPSYLEKNMKFIGYYTIPIYSINAPHEHLK